MSRDPDPSAEYSLDRIADFLGELVDEVGRVAAELAELRKALVEVRNRATPPGWTPMPTDWRCPRCGESERRWGCSGVSCVRPAGSENG